MECFCISELIYKGLTVHAMGAVEALLNPNTKKLQNELLSFKSIEHILNWHELHNKYAVIHILAMNRVKCFSRKPKY